MEEFDLDRSCFFLEDNPATIPPLKGDTVSILFIFQETITTNNKKLNVGYGILIHTVINIHKYIHTYISMYVPITLHYT